MATLNAEPAAPEEREKQQLPPKSYADAVEEEPPVDGANGANATNGTNGVSHEEVRDSKSAGNEKPAPHMASVLKIVDTGASAASEKEEKKQNRPQYDRQESKSEFSATV